MTPLDRAVQAIVRVLESEHIDYAIVGGIANAVWGEPRATIDVDVTISVDPARTRNAISANTPEDLVLMKTVSDRPRDLADAEAIVRRRHYELDRSYLEPRVRELAAALERDDVLERWQHWTAAGEK